MGDQPKMNDALTRGETLGDQVYRWMANSLAAGVYAPLERINIRRLADELRSSVTPVREAVLRLVAEGVLETTEKSAIVVPERKQEEIDEIFDVRLFLECEMAEAAAPNLTDEDVAYLELTQKRFLQALEESDYREVLRLNALFHFSIYRKAELPLRLKIVETLWLRIGPTLRHMYPYLQADRKDHRRHEDIIEAAAKQNGNALRSAIAADLISSKSALYKYIQDSPARAKRRPQRS